MKYKSIVDLPCVIPFTDYSHIKFTWPEYKLRPVYINLLQMSNQLFITASITDRALRAVADYFATSDRNANIKDNNYLLMSLANNICMNTQI